jgi:multiple sugar transport system substrate-binding protein
MKSLSKFTLVPMLLILAMLLAACPGGDAPPPANGTAAEPGAPAAAGAVEIRYALWDASQLPPYEECARTFQEENPNIRIAFEQAGWGDYWTNIQTGMVAGTAPDVFTNHLAKYPEFAELGQLLDIQPLVDQAGIDTDMYLPGLADLWVREGRRYGLPKDWDTVAVIYNVQMLEEAGIDPATMEEWTWNPADGGAFQEVVAQLTLDQNGNNGLSPDFNPENVVQYGFIHQGAGGPYGQTQWSHFAASNGFTFQDEPWGTEYYYDDPRFIETIQWYADLHLEHGYAPSLADVTSLGSLALFQASTGAMTTDGSWMINSYLGSDFEVGFGRLPIGSEGRKSMFNGLADSIWVGTEHPNEAWEWVSFLASPACQNIVGRHAVVFPAIESGVEEALQGRAAQGVDVSAFTEQALDPEGTFLFPIADNASEITAIMEPVMDSIMLGQARAAEILPQANERVNALFR